ncbi:MAG: OmpA family protein [Polyangiaceae bacterium]
MRRRPVLLRALAGAAVAAWSAGAQAQVAPGFALDRFEPSETGSEWFANDTLDLRGKVRPAFGVVADYGYKPYVLLNPDGTENQSLVTDQVILHVGGSLVLFDRLRLGATLPVAVSQTVSATGGLVNGQRILDDGSAGVGDLRLAADLRLFGNYGDAFTLAFGGRVWAPTGSQAAYLGDGQVRIGPHVSIAGDIGAFAYAGSLGVVYRGDNQPFAGHPMGSEADFALALGLRGFDRKLLIGPEVAGSTIITQGSAILQDRTTPLAILGSAHYTAGDFRFGLGAGPGLSHAAGTAAFRGLLSAEWAPGIAAPPPVVEDVTPPDRDHDGVPDADDACPDVPGIRTDDPKTNGCPPDRDHDGIVDAEDACPDVPGIRTDDPATNGCPSDRDRDRVYDTEDACPDVPGVRTSDPKTNGCPPDRDHDGIPDSLDACPDEPGPPNQDPRKNGCPLAFVRDNQIQIAEQVKFRFGLAAIDPASDTILDAVLKVMLEHTEIPRIRVEGHTDNRGTVELNRRLSGARAAAVVDWLVKHGIDRSHLSSQGFGFDRPIDTNDTDEGRANNRRVEFHIEGEGQPKP